MLSHAGCVVGVSVRGESVLGGCSLLPEHLPGGFEVAPHALVFGTHLERGLQVAHGVRIGPALIKFLRPQDADFRLRWIEFQSFFEVVPSFFFMAKANLRDRCRM